MLNMRAVFGSFLFMQWLAGFFFAEGLLRRWEATAWRGEVWGVWLVVGYGGFVFLRRHTQRQDRALRAAGPTWRFVHNRWWIDGSQLWYRDVAGKDWSFEGVAIVERAGAEPGSIWVDPTDGGDSLQYLDEHHMERRLDGVTAIAAQTGGLERYPTDAAA